MGGSLRSLLLGPAEQVAPQLLGCHLVHGEVRLRLTEVEAYAGQGEDPASHAHRGPTPRSAVMFGPPGTAYVYLSYGIHRCLNVVCGPEGRAAAVLVRGAEVVAGLEVTRRRRRPGVADRALARGPGCLTLALGVTLDDDGADLLAGGALRLEPGRPPDAVVAGPRIGISRAVERPWRWWVPGAAGVSAPARITV